MKSEIISTGSAPAAVGPYSQAVRSGGFVFTSGQLGIDPATGELETGFEAQAERAIKNVGEVLAAAAGLTYADAVKTTCFLTDMSNFPAFNTIYAKYFTGKPARSCVAAAALPKGALVEIEVIAADNG